MAARFNLKKGDRFTLKKSEGLSNLTVSLGWKCGEKADLDVSAFLLGEDGVILNDADFVFYNSENREEDFSREKFGNKKVWRQKMRPVSHDGSVIGSIDDVADDEEGEEAGEEMQVNLNKTDGKITEIVFCVSIHEERVTFEKVKDAFISIINDDNGEELCRYNLKERFKHETAVVAGRLLCDEEGEWTFEAVGDAFTGGMQALIDIYA